MFRDGIKRASKSENFMKIKEIFIPDLAEHVEPFFCVKAKETSYIEQFKRSWFLIGNCY
jgi:hypothetical protein